MKKGRCCLVELRWASILLFFVTPFYLTVPAYAGGSRDANWIDQYDSSVQTFPIALEPIIEGHRVFLNEAINDESDTCWQGRAAALYKEARKVTDCNDKRCRQFWFGYQKEKCQCNQYQGTFDQQAVPTCAGISIGISGTVASGGKFEAGIIKNIHWSVNDVDGYFPVKVEWLPAPKTKTFVALIPAGQRKVFHAWPLRRIELRKSDREDFRKQCDEYLKGKVSRTKGYTFSAIALDRTDIGVGLYRDRKYIWGNALVLKKGSNFYAIHDAVLGETVRLGHRTFIQVEGSFGTDCQYTVLLEISDEGIKQVQSQHLSCPS